MHNSILWSLRLGFSTQQAFLIKKQGIEFFLEQSFNNKIDTNIPSVLDTAPKNLKAFKQMKQKVDEADKTEKVTFLKEQRKTTVGLQKWWINQMINNEFPLREKMVLFWHNHFVSTIQKVKINWWVYQHNQVLREQAFGNFKELTKAVLKTNAMVKYLDNIDNRKGEINENLSRELLELFTLGIGNYTEQDIQNGAKALAGLGIGQEGAVYRPVFEVDETITYLGKTGTFKSDDLVDIIFQHPKAPYFITEKILKWFIYDNPPKDLVITYGDYLKKVDYEIKPFLKKIFIDEYDKNTAGSKIKNPLEYILNITSELQLNQIDQNIAAFFTNQQGMQLFNQPNVKGWNGGKDWLTTQLYVQRSNIADILCSSLDFDSKKFNRFSNEENNEAEKINIQSRKINYTKGNNKQIINELSDRLLFNKDLTIQKNLEELLPYDFDANANNADEAVLRVFNYIIKTPEFQII